MRKSRKNKFLAVIKTVGICAGAAWILAGCAGSETDFQVDKDVVQEIESRREVVEFDQVPDISQVHLRDNKLLYQKAKETDVVTMYLTVSTGNESENTNHTWSEINTWSVYDYAQMGVKRYQINGLLQVGDENGPLPGELGYGEKAPNAVVQIRGQTSSRNSQKNYKIKLKDNKGTWNGQKTIALNKHQTEGLRFRNKLGFRLLQDIPQLVGLRTQFVHLYVKDESDGGSGKFEDYGLYTQVEQLNKTALRAHGLDPNGHLYKLNFFEFFRYEDIIRKEDDPEFNLASFEGLLEIKGDRDHTKLIKMLEDVNDISIPIDQVLDTWFDRENICYWMAFNILINNVDTQSRNVYLYSPLNSNIWYFIPWDIDSSFLRLERQIKGHIDGGSWQSGISNYWGSVLFRRCLKSERFRNQLDDAISQLRELFTEKYLMDLVRQYGKVVKPYLYRMPDRMHAPLTEEQYDRVLEGIPKDVEKSYHGYLRSLEKPMPFFIGVPEVENGRLKLIWDQAYDLDAETIEYTVELASDYLFQYILFRQEHLMITETECPLPRPGQYFIRIRAKNTSGESQEAFDYYVAENGKNYGMKCFYVNSDGTITEDIYEE